MLISESYSELNKELHEKDPSWGTTADQWLSVIKGLMTKHKPASVLDYGCGKAVLAGHIPFIQSYDPNVPGYDIPPDAAELVLCVDVLEHIEPECIDAVLDDLRRLTKAVGFFVICTVPAVAVLSDGRNAHLIVESAEWWRDKIAKRFDIIDEQSAGINYVVTVGAKDGSN